MEVAWRSLVKGDEGCIGPSQVVSCCVCDKLKKVMYLLGITWYMFDYCANPVVHLILLKSSIVLWGSRLQACTADYIKIKILFKVFWT